MRSDDFWQPSNQVVVFDTRSFKNNHLVREMIDNDHITWHIIMNDNMFSIIMISIMIIIISSSSSSIIMIVVLS